MRTSRSRRAAADSVHGSDEVAIRLELWQEGDLPLLRKLMGDPAMMEYLGGRESDEKIAERQARYERPADSSKSNMFKILDAATGEAVGSVGYWEKPWRTTRSTSSGGQCSLRSRGGV